MLLLLSTTAFAAEGMLPSQIKAEAESISDNGRSVVVIVQSNTAANTIRGFMGDVEVLASGDPSGALASAGVDCGLSLTKAGPGSYWNVTRIGSCEAAPSHSEGASTTPVAPAAAGPPPRGSSPGPRSAPMPPPRPAIDTDALGRYLEVQVTAPDPTAALLSSTLLGFGAGHFYAGNTQRGATHAALQGGGILLTVIGVAVAPRDPGLASALTTIGGGTAGVSRVVDIWTAPYSARDEAQRMARRVR